MPIPYRAVRRVQRDVARWCALRSDTFVLRKIIISLYPRQDRIERTLIVSRPVTKPKKQPGITHRRNHSGHLRIVRANLRLLRRLYKVRLKEGTGWWLATVMDYFQRPKKHEEDLIHTCWACGRYCDDGVMNRAHVVACRHGGDDTPGNYFLLCDYCHEQQPDEATREDQIAWLENREYFWDRIGKNTQELLTALENACEGDKRITTGFYSFAIRRDIREKAYVWAKRHTGSISKVSDLADKLMIAMCERWVRRVKRAGMDLDRVERACRRKVSKWLFLARRRIA